MMENASPSLIIVRYSISLVNAVNAMPDSWYPEGLAISLEKYHRALSKKTPDARSGTGAKEFASSAHSDGCWALIRSARKYRINASSSRTMMGTARAATQDLN